MGGGIVELHSCCRRRVWDHKAFLAVCIRCAIREKAATEDMKRMRL